ncbi:hypothetical protein DYH10_01160 [Candidatus Saccharibacteria bacterium CPR2]|nr:hypothetical protein [Candidatus Saccharibacteria bacterium CPR2]
MKNIISVLIVSFGMFFVLNFGLVANAGSIQAVHQYGVFNPDNCPKDGAQVPVEQNCIITEILVPIVRFLLVGVGVVVTVMIVLGGIQYLTSEGNPQRIAAAKSKIMNALIALLIWAFMGLILNWLIPGGILNIGLGNDIPNL